MGNVLSCWERGRFAAQEVFSLAAKPSNVLNCREPACMGWSLLPTDQFCSWCGSRLVELAVGFETKVGESWEPLSPSVLNRERPPALRLKIAHVGEAGLLELRPEHVHCSASWIGFDGARLAEFPTLSPEEEIVLLVNRLKVPGKEDSAQEARINVVVGDLHQHAVLQFVPAPRFELELSSKEILLSAEGAPALDAALYLRSGRVWLESAPRFDASWAKVELVQEESSELYRFPLELDVKERSRLPLRITLDPEEMSDIRASGSENPAALKRTTHLKLVCRDRGLKVSASTKSDALEIEQPLSLTFVLAPEVYLEPFGQESRRDWTMVLGANTDQPMRLAIHNGTPGTGGRQDLVVRQFSLRQGELDWLALDSPRPLPWTIPSGQSLEIKLRLDERRLPKQRARIESTAELVLVSNDPIHRSYFLRVVGYPAEAYPGALVIDFGTSNTCAALVDENRAIQLLDLDPDQEADLPSAVCYLRLRQQRELEVGQRALERTLEPAAARSVVVAAKRRVGFPDQPFAVVPLDEPAETHNLSAESVACDIYAEVIAQATRTLLAQGHNDMVITRLVITHPSRFSLQQVNALRQASLQALQANCRRYLGDAAPTLDPPFTLHEPIGAALHFLNDWRSHAQVLQERQQAVYPLLVYDLGGGTLDITLMSVDVQRAGQSSYTVSPTVLGSSGERWLGGQDVTRALYDLVVERLPEPVLLKGEGSARRNHNLLLAWCERLKIALVEGVPCAEMLPSLFVRDADGRDKLVGGSALRRGMELPTLDELEEAVRPRLEESLERAVNLLRRHDLSDSEQLVVLRVGKGSRLPLVDRLLRMRFPEALQLAPEELKACVVQGACTTRLPGVSSGIQLSRTVERPGVRLKLSSHQSLAATTSRLGIKVIDGGKTWFQEVIGEGIPIPPEGLQSVLEGAVLEIGENRLVLLENASYNDAMVIDGKANPDVQALQECVFRVEQGSDEAVIRFLMSPDLNIQVQVEIEGQEPLLVGGLESAQIGRFY